MARLSAVPIINFANVNQFSVTSQWSIRAGDPNVLIFQLVDLDQNGLRYAVIGSSPSVMVTFPSIDSAQAINAPAVQDTSDKSIWSVTLSQLQKPNSGNVQFAVTEGGNTKRLAVLNMISVEYIANGQA